VRKYQKYARGDIVGIRNNSLQQVVSYTYDSWGKVVSVKDNNGNEITDQNNIGNLNPMRYRGYYYDKETRILLLGKPILLARVW